MTPKQAVKEFKTVAATAQALEVSRQTIYTWLDEGAFPTWANAMVAQKIAELREKKAKAK